ncbi:MAG: undecaprenyl-diphosphate phosphatase [Gammaproteobacteria bacterium]|nr:undecaprenyl-diphosphate phosphatase [Gammaproteobacteria bacterium]
MTDWLQAILLAVLQGLTEFLPISSSAHLILPSQVLGWADQGLAFDVAVHVGSLLAVVGYFRKDLLELAVGGYRSLSSGGWNAESDMILWLFLATLPVGIAGLLLDDFVAAELRSVLVIAITTLVFGLLLGWADSSRREDQVLGLRIAVLVGCAQVLAIIPGTSRSGITMTAALLCGLERETAARFSFLLSVPVIGAAGTLQVVRLLSAGDSVPWLLLLTATLVSAVTAYLCISWFLRLINRIGFMPFVIYRCLLGLVLLWLWW